MLSHIYFVFHFVFHFDLFILFISDYVTENLDFSLGNPACRICGKTFTILTNARRHIRSLHYREGFGDFDCTVCGKKFDRIRSYDDHMRKAHNVFKKSVDNQSY